MRVLIVEDRESTRSALVELVSSMEGLECDEASSLEEARKALSCREYEMVLTDLKLPDGDGAVLIEEASPALVMIMTAYGSIENAVEAMRRGAFDYVTKPFGMDEIEMRLRRCMEAAGERIRNEGLSLENRDLRRRLLGSGRLVAASPAMKKIDSLIDRIAGVASSVLITGESGTGKEVVARELHERSRRSDRPFIRVNCAAIPAQLLESELFGHEKGAFTGATKPKRGRFELANEGTIFLDEIGDLPLELQSKLLRVLQEKEFERVGGERTIRVDTRIIAATNRDLQRLVREGSFREDLYYRLDVLRIHIPPLRERKEDIPPLVEHFLAKAAEELNKPSLKARPGVISACLAYEWPGNVRELANAVERAAVLAEDDKLRVEDLGIPVVEPAGSRAGRAGAGKADLEGLAAKLAEYERSLILAALKKHSWNRTKAAEELGMKRTSLLYRMEKLGISAPGRADEEQR